MITTKVILRTARMSANGKSPLIIRITKSRKHVYLGTGIKLTSNEWDCEHQKVKKAYKSHLRANALLKSIISELENITYGFDKDKKPYTVKMIKELFINNDSNTDLLIFADRWISDRYNRKEITYSTLVRYKAVIEKLKEYVNGEVLIRNFNADLLRGFQLFLQNTKNNSKNTIASNFSFLRAVANALIQQDLMKLNDYPFRNWKIGYEDTKRKYISLEQLGEIENIQLKDKSKIAKCRDIFLFCNQMGFRIGDAMRLKLGHLNNTHVAFQRQKGKDFVTLKLTNKATVILNRHINKTMNKEDYIFSFLTHRKQNSDDKTAFAEHRSATALINKNLGIICTRLGFELQASSHFARHSMATNALASGLSMEEIQGILGHKDVRTTQIYAKAHNKMLDNAIDKLNQI